MANASLSYIADKNGCYTLSKATPAQVIQLAASLLEDRLQGCEALTQPDDTKNYLSLRLGHLEHEVFGCLFLDNRHRVLCFEELSRGTIDQTSVYPREVVKAAIKCNAAAVILAHNHPSGVPEPSQADKRLTQRLKEALSLIDVRVLDHVVTGGVDAVSFVERGLI